MAGVVLLRFQQVLRINVLGCDALPHTFYGLLAASIDCDAPHALGWIIVPWFLFINIIGAYILPTVCESAHTHMPAFLRVFFSSIMPLFYCRRRCCSCVAIPPLL